MAKQISPDTVPGENSLPGPERITPLQTLGYIIRTMRPRQWNKNVFVFLGLVFALHLKPQYFGEWVTCLAAFALFCLMSSCVYLLNDLVDIDKDRKHIRKRLRPLPSGKLKPWQAKIALVVIFFTTLFLSFFAIPLLGQLPGNSGVTNSGLGFGMMITLYFLLQTAYSFVLKNVMILDVFALAAGFVIRAIAGAVVINVQISYWFYLVLVLGALFLALGKRRHEILLLGSDAGDHRKILTEYSPELIQEMVSIVTTSTLIAYSLYTYFGETVPANHMMMLTIPFVLYGVFRYLYLVYRRDEGGSPDELLFKDKGLLIDLALWAILVFIILYFFNTDHTTITPKFG